MKEIDSREKSVLITGGTSGLGIELVKIFLKNGFYVIATGRNHIVLPGFEDRFKLIQVDFSNMKEISDTIKKVILSYNLNLVINNDCFRNIFNNFSPYLLYGIRYSIKIRKDHRIFSSISGLL